MELCAAVWQGGQKVLLGWRKPLKVHEMQAGRHGKDGCMTGQGLLQKRRGKLTVAPATLKEEVKPCGEGTSVHGVHRAAQLREEAVGGCSLKSTARKAGKIGEGGRSQGGLRRRRVIQEDVFPKLLFLNTI